MQFQKNRRLSEFSTFGIGGPIRDFVEVSTIEEMEEAVRLGTPYLIIGKGSNCLFDDAGFDGLVILNKIDSIEWKGNRVTVGAGYSFSLLGAQSAKRGYAGLEFASGIPATVGGAIFMNAGANGKETCDALESVVFFDGERKTYERSDLKFGYRKSPFQNKQGVILSATFILKEESAARSNQLKIIDYRMKTQPLKDKSAGCIFRNPPGVSAGKLIESCSLKGFSIGGAAVSDMHANFIVNKNNATAKDVRDLIAHIQQKVLEKTGVMLESEVRIIDAL